MPAPVDGDAAAARQPRSIEPLDAKP